MSEDPAAPNGGLAEAPSSPFLFDASVFDRETPEYFVPKMGGAISEPAYFQQIVIRDPDVPAPGEVSEITRALDPFAAPSRSQAPQRPVQGVLLTVEQAWRQDHLALGRLLHSLCLAPGEDAKFAEPYTSEDAGPIAEDTIAMPSGGVFGEAVLGQAIAAEKIDLTRFWNWQDSPIPILPPAMQPVAVESRARDVTFSPATLEPALAEIIERELPEGVEAAPIVKAVSDHLRASTGAGGLDALLAAQVAAALVGAAAAGDRTVQTQKNLQDFTVGMANSELGKAAATALVPKAGGSATVLGGVLGGARPAGNGKAAPAKVTTGGG